MLKSTGRGGSQLEALRRAALDFVATPEFRADTLSLVGFSSQARILCPPGAVESLSGPLKELRAAGLTNIGRGLDVAREVLDPARDEERWILLFTDGKPQTLDGVDPVLAARRAAAACRDSGIRIVAVGTGLADRELLTDITGDPASVFHSAPEKLGESFKSSGERIHDRQMLASTPAEIDFRGSLERACGWAALVGFGAGLALVIGHNRHLRRRVRPRLAQMALVLVGAAASGLAAGAAGQGTFYALTETAHFFQPALRTLAWILLGSGVVLGMSFFVPNLPRGRALAGGALGGAAAAACFLKIVPAVGDTPGRLLGAAILGLMAGAMTVLVEASVRKAWLVVHWPGGEKSILLLGAKPIVVGHSASADVCPVFDEKRDAVLGVFLRTEQGNWFEDRRTQKRRRLRGGDRLAFDEVVVEVHEERGEAASRPSVAVARTGDPVTSARREVGLPRPKRDPARART